MANSGCYCTFPHDDLEGTNHVDEVSSLEGDVNDANFSQEDVGGIVRLNEEVVYSDIVEPDTFSEEPCYYDENGDTGVNEACQVVDILHDEDHNGYGFEDSSLCAEVSCMGAGDYLQEEYGCYDDAYYDDGSWYESD